MPSQLLSNDKVSFVVAKPFTSRGVTYEMGDDFPQEAAPNIEVFVRARFVIPVVDDVADKPKSWHKEIRPRDEVLERLSRERVQLVMPEPYHEHDQQIDLDVLTHPETTPPPEETPDEPEETPDEPEVEPESEPESQLFNPSDHTVNEVNEYLAAHPDDYERVLAAERADRGRKGILGDES